MLAGVCSHSPGQVRSSWPWNFLAS
jgi:hypothetical protein